MGGHSWKLDLACASDPKMHSQPFPGVSLGTHPKPKPCLKVDPLPGAAPEPTHVSHPLPEHLVTQIGLVFQLATFTL